MWTLHEKKPVTQKCNIVIVYLPYFTLSLLLFSIVKLIERNESQGILRLGFYPSLHVLWKSSSFVLLHSFRKYDIVSFLPPFLSHLSLNLTSSQDCL